MTDEDPGDSDFSEDILGGSPIQDPPIHMEEFQPDLNSTLELVKRYISFSLICRPLHSHK
jgi:hypothetical protein